MNTPKPHIVIAGGTGFLGRALTTHFQTTGYDLTILSRSPNLRSDGVREIAWDACSLGGWTKELEGAHAVVNLVGRSVNCRYNARNRRLILESRINSTRAIGLAITNSKAPPPVWLNASTATIYKHTFGPAWNESGEIGYSPDAKDKFSIEVATAWERSLNETPTPLTRRVVLRTAMVFGEGKNSVFPVLRRLVCLGLGGRLASGRQYVSWIHQTDFCRAVEWLITHDQFKGPVNLCAPNPITNAEMMRTLREICAAPMGLPAAKWMLEIGAFLLRTETELTIKSRRVVPAWLVASGFDFQFAYLSQAIKDLRNKMEVA